jgi:2,3-diketo-5-methylthio-1-phosphopentane phosphatase
MTPTNPEPRHDSGNQGGSAAGRLLVICDFDGTVCRVDMCNEILDRFAGDWEAIDRAYAAGEVGSRAAYSSIAPKIRTDKPQLLDFIRQRERLDPFFPEFLDFCRRRMIDVKIVSDGLDLSIAVVLEKYGLEVEFYANRLIFRDDGRVGVDFPPPSAACGRCGNCKRALIDRFRPGYERIFYVGDGHSDICAAGLADEIFAKGVLYEKCREKGTPCELYDDFGDVCRALDERLRSGGRP